jgi:hypothetical protein
MFDLEPDTARIVRAEIVEADLPNVTDNQAVEIQPESDPGKAYVGKVLAIGMRGRIRRVRRTGQCKAVSDLRRRVPFRVARLRGACRRRLR